MTTTQTTEALATALEVLTAEVEIAFIQRTDSAAAKLVWEYKVEMLNKVAADAKAA